MQMPPLGQSGFRPLAVDLRGFGGTPYPGGTISVPIMAADVVRTLDRLEIHRAHVVGISMGGTVALQLALDWPERVARLILVNTFARLQPRHPVVWPYYALRAVMVMTVGVSLQARLVSRRLFPRADQDVLRRALYDQILAANPVAYRRAMLAMARFDVSRRLPEIEHPTLVVTGERDTTVPPETQQALSRAIPDAQHLTISNAGHGVTGEAPARFNRALMDFLSSADPPEDAEPGQRS